MFKKLRIRTKILLAFALIAVITVVTIAIVAFSIAQSTLEEESFNKLTAVREMKANQIEDYFQFIRDQLVTQSNDRMMIDAMNAFSTNYYTIDVDQGLDSSAILAKREELLSYYQDEFLERLVPNLLLEVDAQEYLPSEKFPLVMQDLYISGNPYETGSKDLLDNPGDGSRYSESHWLYHPIIRDFLERFGYYDIFLVDPQGNIVYSVFKEVDFGTSLISGPYADTNFGEVFRAALAADEPGAVLIADFEPYHPSYNAPASFIASPIFDGDEKVGVLIFQMPIDRINSIMTNNQNWSDVGLGESGETYLVGPDLRLRNQSRFLIEDSDNYFQAIDAAGVPLATIGQIRNLNSTIGLQEVDTEGTRAALAGETGTAIFPDYRDVPVLSSYKPLDIEGLEWVIMSEIDEAEAFASIDELAVRLALGSVGLIIFIVFAAFFFSRSLTNPIVELQSQANEISAGNMEMQIAIDSEDEIGDLADALETMRVSNLGLVDDLAEINRNLENLVAERTAELEASERQSTSIIEQSGDAIIVIDGQGKVLVWNARAEQMFGYSAEEMAGEAMERIVPETYSQRHQEAFEQATELGYLKNPGVTHELSANRSDGGEFPVELSISQWELGGKNYFSASIRDITERKQAELAIREREERIRSIVEIAPDAIISIDGQQNIIMFNSTAEEIFGYDVDEVLGQPLTILMPEGSRAIHGHEVEKFLAESASARSMDSRREIFGRRKDGAIFPAEAGISKLELDGQIIFTAFFRDITERKRAAEALQRSEERLAFALEGSNDGLWDWNPQTDTLFFSPRWQTMLGFEPGELEPAIGTWEELVHPEDLDRVSRIMAEHLAGNSPSYEAEYRLQSKDGEWVWILARGKVASFDEDGKPIRFVGTHVDISERKRLEADIANQLSFIRTLIDTVPNPIFAVGPDQRYMLFNRAYEEAYGREAKDQLGKTVMDIETLSLEEREFYRDQNLELLANGGMIHDELDIRFADGKMHSILQWVTAFEQSDGRIGGLVGITADITEIKELERELAIANERMSTELNFARDIQISMLPLIFPAFPDRKEVSVSAALESAREVGGDFYDFYFLDDDHLAFIVGDVSGKGAPGALMMAVSKTLIKSRAADDFEPASILTHVNDELSQDNVSSMFVTVFLAVLNVKTGEFVYTNAGHNPPYIRRKDGSIQKIDAFHGPVIGAMPGMPYGQDRDRLDEGDVILVYSDGVTEAFNEQEELFSEERLERLLKSKSLGSDASIVTGTQEALRKYVGQAEQSDDITLLAVQFLLGPEEMETEELQITIKNRYEDMGIVDEQFTAFAEENELPDSVRQSMSIVLDELLNNVISYAYKGEKEKEIEVGFELSGNRLVLTIKDSGVPFNPFASEPPDITESIEERAIGGLGIHMVRNMMDEYSYQRQINKNVVTLVKLLDDEPAD